jgi:hypothetical protein
MSDEDIIKLLKASLLSEDAPPLTDAEVDAFLSVPDKSSPATLKRMRKQFVSKVLEDLHPEPVRKVQRGLHFGSWVELTRESARLTRDAVGEALGKDRFYVERVEGEEILPWKLTPAKAADIVILFRLHIDGLTQLLSESLAAARDAEVIRRQHEALLRGGVPSSDLYAGMTRRGDRYSASPESERESRPTLSEEVIRFLEKIRKILEQRKAAHLLD